jgi:hypothetical protein
MNKKLVSGMALGSCALVAAATLIVAKAGAARNFSCIGGGKARITERLVVGTVDSQMTLTNVTVTQTHQKVGGAMVKSSVVVLNTPKSEVTFRNSDAMLDRVGFILNELPRATAADVGRFAFTYDLMLPKKLPAGANFDAWMSYEMKKGYEGSAANDQRWHTTDVQAFGLKCAFV